MITIDEANVYQSTAKFANETTGVAIDPTTVSFVYEVNGDPTTKVTLHYTSATTPAPGTIARTVAGTYIAQVDLTTIAGSMERYWQSTGAGQAVSPVDVVIVAPLKF